MLARADWKARMLWVTVAIGMMALVSAEKPTKSNQDKLPFEAVFQGLCENNAICEHLCFNLHDGTFECDCQRGYTLEPDGYSCTKLNYSKSDASVLYEKEASFVAILDDDYQSEDYQGTYSEGKAGDDGPHVAKLRQKPIGGGDAAYDYNQLIDKADILNYDRYKTRFFPEHSNNVLGGGEETGPETYLELDSKDLLQPYTSPGPNLEQKVPSEVPNLEATESLNPLCEMECGVGRCHLDGHAGVPRCMCPLGRAGRYCHPDWSVFPVIMSGGPIETARFHGSSWVAFAPLREAYRDVQLTIEFKPEAPDGLLLVSGENDDLSGDFMAAVLINTYVEFRWDCGSGAGLVKSPEGVHMGEWNRLTVYRHRWDVWLQLNDGHHVQGRSEGLFSRITFQEPLYVGGSNNLTSLAPRLGVTTGLQGCVRRLQVNDHIYKFRKNDPLRSPNLSSDYAALDGWDISECVGDACSEVECQHGGKCVSSTSPHSAQEANSSAPYSTMAPPSSFFAPQSSAPICLCPLGYTGDFCEKQLNLEVPSFNGSSHLMFPALGGSVLSWLELELVFRAASTEGVLLYESHRSDGTGDFIALTLSQAHVLFTIDLGSGMLTLRSVYPIRPGVWHSARVSRTGRWTWLYVDDQPVVSGLTPGGFTMLSLSHPLYLGGIPPTSASQPILPAAKAFTGCIQKLALNSRTIHLVSGAVSGSNVGSCDHPCSQRPCDNGGVCEPHGPSYSCRCPLGFKDDHCRSRVVTQVATPSFSGRSFLKYADPEIMKRVSGDKLHLWLRFRSLTRDGLLVWAGEEGDDGEAADIIGPALGDSISLELQDGRLVLRYNLGSGFAKLVYNTTNRLDDGQWHTVKVSRYEREGRISVDGEEESVVVSPGDLVQLNVDSSLYIGGRETFRGSHNGYVVPGLTGCVADLTLATDYHVDLITQATAGQNIDYC
ncbi:pikachurin-like isoform X1 [Macrobrachium rosenbergii]|uniref:pikachurin-like isoform X1 n=1 Tax=Macrobrachium rosenbergii TaxID=79674 RepID=UPI0034D4C0B9